jgi:hypothetical protein
MNTNVTKDFTIASLQQAFPSKKNTITQEVVDLINNSANEPEFQGETLLKTAITYEAVLQRNKASITEYLNAVRFCAYMISLDDNYTEAYKKTFNDREFVKARANESTTSPKYKELTSAASRYRKTKVVVDILTVSQVPLDLMFTGAKYKAVGVLADLMESAKYDKDRIAAAKELLAATKGPENMKIELDVGVKENSAVQQLNDQLANIAARQKGLLESGASTLGDFGAMSVKDEDEVLEGEFTHG